MVPPSAALYAACFQTLLAEQCLFPLLEQQDRNNRATKQGYVSQQYNKNLLFELVVFIIIINCLPFLLGCSRSTVVLVWKLRRPEQNGDGRHFVARWRHPST